MISDYQRRGSNFIETYKYLECRQHLNSTNCLLICGNPGEGKTRYAVELLCSKTEHRKRLFVTSAQQLENIDLENIDGLVLDNMYGDISLDEDEYKRWKKHIPYLVSRSQCGTPFYVILTSRSYILKSTDESLISTLPKVELLTKDLTETERMSILNSHCNIKNPRPFITMLESPIGLPQLCYLYSVSIKFRGEDIFRYPERFIHNMLETLQREESALFVALALLVFHNDNLVVSDVKTEELDSIKNFTGICICLGDIERSLDRFSGMFVHYDEMSGVYRFLHDSLFETCCSYVGKKHSNMFMALSDVRVLVKFARIKNQKETDYRIYTYLPNNKTTIQKLALRYATEMKINTSFKRILSKTDVLFCEELLEEFLRKLEDDDMRSSFLNDKDANESLLVEFCNMNQPQLIKIILKELDKNATENWVQLQKRIALKRCRRWNLEECLMILNNQEVNITNEYNDSDVEENTDVVDFALEDGIDDTLRTEMKIMKAMKTRDESAFWNILKTGKLSEANLYNFIRNRISEGQQVEFCFETNPCVTNELIRHSIRCKNQSSFIFFIQRAIGDRISLQAPEYEPPLDGSIKTMIPMMDKENRHLLALFGLVNSCWNDLADLKHTTVPDIDLQYMYDMEKSSERYTLLASVLRDVISQKLGDVKIANVLTRLYNRSDAHLSLDERNIISNFMDIGIRLHVSQNNDNDAGNFLLHDSQNNHDDANDCDVCLNRTCVVVGLVLLIWTMVYIGVFNLR